MQIETIFHQPYEPYLYINDNHSYVIRLQSKKDDLKKVQVYYGDPFLFSESGWKYEQPIEMKKVFSTKLHDFWECLVEPPNKRLKYAFKVSNQSNNLFFGETGFCDQLPLFDLSFYFTKPYLHLSDRNYPPKWVKNTVWYQIFPDRFENGDELNDPVNILPWGLPPKSSSFYGGDLQGIIDKLDYLKGLGITGIYLTPIFESPSNHKYDTTNYFRIDSQFGDERQLKKLIQICHKRGIKVMLDAVFNHTSQYFPPFQDVIKNGINSVYKDWFHIHSFPVVSSPVPNYETFSFVSAMPKLNTENKDVQKYLLSVGAYWLREYDIDGWRLDVANEINHNFWREFRKEMKTIKKDVYLLGEIWHFALPWLKGDQFDSVMNYPLSHAILSFFAFQNCNSAEFINNINYLFSQYTTPTLFSLFNLVGSHDTPRILTQCKQNERLVILIYVFLFTFYGTPCVYYGDEIGLIGGGDPECRGCMSWNESDQNKQIYDVVKKLISLRKNHPLIANDGQFKWHSFENEPNLIIYERSNEKEVYLIILNRNEKTSSIKLPFQLLSKKITNIWTNEQFSAESNAIFVDVTPYSYLILHFPI
ncbi:alpha-glycosidase [Bacillus sp. RG28]|uniref:Alpha-glycosidase n=1 Tax=Gottfriedia endophytica TaxID=2820819 RepID=A0A940NFL5_9BACI|nr:alpha-glycosidase [Gottfriedia endophytica]MBP0724569.1 alpha-glycosidase [Gottfriedia endophytica]